MAQRHSHKNAKKQWMNKVYESAENAAFLNQQISVGDIHFLPFT